MLVTQRRRESNLGSGPVRTTPKLKRGAANGLTESLKTYTDGCSPNKKASV